MKCSVLILNRVAYTL